MDHWPKHARAWARLGPPLRPSPEDTAFAARELPARPIHLLVLGVTPELVGLPLAAGSTVTAVDRSSPMIDTVFVGGPGRRALVGEWTALPVDRADMIAGDGCTTVLSPDKQRAFAAELARVCAPDGIIVQRVFVSPEEPESLADVAAALPRIGSFDALKWRIAMAIQPASRLVEVAGIRDAFDSIVPDRDVLPWPRDTVDMIDNYAGSPAVYSFPTLAELRAVFAPHLAERACHVPGYELGERCPTLVMQPILAARARAGV